MFNPEDGEHSTLLKARKPDPLLHVFVAEGVLPDSFCFPFFKTGSQIKKGKVMSLTYPRQLFAVMLRCRKGKDGPAGTGLCESAP